MTACTREYLLANDNRDSATTKRLRQSTSREQFVESTLTTNDRVIARVTDGIYRQPGSALRELIANAYDADASWVSVKTDAPRFDRITVEDDGSGMTPEAVVHLLHNIGGSAKRTSEGHDLGITSSSDSDQSPGGRKLIGKLGIGIFSVSQLTHSFQIITKTAGDAFKTVILVRLSQFSEAAVKPSGAEFTAGTYQIWREKTEDEAAHGTTIVLTSIRPQTKDSLRSEQMWNAATSPLADEERGKSRTVVPMYHIGRVSKSSADADGLDRDNVLPWSVSDAPHDAFRKLVNSVWDVVKGRTTVKLADIFDSYLQMVWNLALALPLPYIERDIFNESVADDWAYFFKLANKTGVSAERLYPKDEVGTVGDLAGIPAPALSISEFRVFVDAVELLRPLKYRNLPNTSHVLKKPMVFLGHMREEFAGYDVELSAGALDFNAYLFWTPKVAPTEHQGVLVRIHGASGTLFDSTFFNYQVAELTRLRQITCEIFVNEGLEAALNIDRESFNTSHPHTVILTSWLHAALRQLATAQKREAEALRAQARRSAKEKTVGRVEAVLSAANLVRSGGEGIIPTVRIVQGLANEPSNQDDDGPVYSLTRLREELSGGAALKIDASDVWRAEAIANVLSIYGVLDSLTQREQENLIASILGILGADNNVD